MREKLRHIKLLISSDIDRFLVRDAPSLSGMIQPTSVRTPERHRLLYVKGVVLFFGAFFSQQLGVTRASGSPVPCVVLGLRVPSLFCDTDPQ